MVLLINMDVSKELAKKEMKLILKRNDQKFMKISSTIIVIEQVIV